MTTIISIPKAKAGDREALRRAANGRPFELQVLDNGVTVVFQDDLDEETRAAVIGHLRRDDTQGFLDIEAPTLEQVAEQVRRLTRALEG